MDDNDTQDDVQQRPTLRALDGGRGDTFADIAASGALTDFSMSLSDAVRQTLCGYWDAQTVDAQQRLLDAWERGDDVALIVQVTGHDGRVIVAVDVGAFVDVEDAPPAPGTGNYL